MLKNTIPSLENKLIIVPTKSLETQKKLQKLTNKWKSNFKLVPLLEISINEINFSTEKYLNRLENEFYQYVFITSANTVSFLTKNCVDIPDSTKIITVGKKTSLALQAKGYKVYFHPKKAANSEQISREFIQKISKQATEIKILLFQSPLADKNLLNELNTKKILVDEIIPYKVNFPKISLAQTKLLEQADLILVTSGSVAKKLKDLDIKFKNLICIGEKTAVACDMLDLPYVAVSSEQSIEGILKTYQGILTQKYLRNSNVREL